MRSCGTQYPAARRPLGPGEHKKDFVIFDVCQNIEYFNEDYPSAEASVGTSLRERLFRARIALLARYRRNGRRRGTRRHARNSRRFREKARSFLRGHADHLTLAKLRLGHQLTDLDLAELERIMIESGQFEPNEIAAAAAEAQGLGHFVRSLLGMDRGAAADALSAFAGGTTLTGNQLVFVNLIVNQLAQRGTVDPALLYEAPFTGVARPGRRVYLTAPCVA